MNTREYLDNSIPVDEHHMYAYTHYQSIGK